MRRPFSRREMIAGLGTSTAMLALGVDAEAQSGRTYRIVILETVPAELNRANLSALVRGLQERGYVEGQNLQIEYRSADGLADRFPQLAAELVRLSPDLIVTRGTPATKAAKEATDTIPIVFTAIGEPVAAGVRRGPGIRNARILTGAASLDAVVAGVTLLVALAHRHNRPYPARSCAQTISGEPSVGSSSQPMINGSPSCFAASCARTTPARLCRSVMASAA